MALVESLCGAVATMQSQHKQMALSQAAFTPRQNLAARDTISAHTAIRAHHTNSPTALKGL